jgi:hypothetical protein
MNVGTPFITNRQSAKSIQPGMSPLHHPAIAPKAFLRLNTASSNPRYDVALAKRGATSSEIISFVCMQLGRPLAGPTSGKPDRRDRINGPFQRGRIMFVCRRQNYCERDALPIDHKVALRARFAAIRRIWAGFGPPFFAGTLEESSAARSQSMPSYCPISFKSTCRICSQIPACCQSRNRLQQLIPQPLPISCGSISQGIPDRRTKMIPVNASRLSIGGRPPLGFGAGSGSNGSIRSQSSSGTSGLAITVSPLR